MDGAIRKRLSLIVGMKTAQVKRGMRTVSAGLTRMRTLALGFGRTLGRALRSPLAMLGAGGGIFALIMALRKITGLGVDFEQTMAVVSGVMRATATESQQLVAAARRMGEITEWTASQAGQSLQFLGMAGFTATKALAALPGTLDLATAGNIDLGRAADIATNALTAMGLPVQELTRINDVFVGTITRSNTNMEMMAESFKYAAPVARAYKYSIEELSAMIGALGNAGIQGSMAGTQLAMAMMKTDLVARKLGVSGGKFIDVLVKLRAKGVDVTKVMAAFGMRSGRAAGVLYETTDAAKEFAETLTHVEGEAKRLADIMRSTLGGTFKELKSVIESVALDTFDTYKIRMKVAVKDAIRWIRENKDEIVDFAGVAINRLGDLVKELRKISKWFYDNRGTVATVFAVSGLMLFASYLSLITTRLLAAGAALKAFYATMMTGALGKLLWSGAAMKGGLMAGGLAGAATVIAGAGAAAAAAVGGWVLIADAAGTAVTKAKEAAGEYAQALKEMEVSTIVTWEKINDVWVRQEAVVGAWLEELNKVKEAKLEAALVGRGQVLPIPGAYVTGVDEEAAERRMQASKAETEATKAAIKDLKFEWAGYYELRKAQLAEEAAMIGNSVVAYEWYDMKLRELNADRLAWQEEDAQRSTDLLARRDQALGGSYSWQESKQIEGYETYENYVFKMGELYIADAKFKETAERIKSGAVTEGERNRLNVLAIGQRKAAALLQKGMTGEMKMRNALGAAIVQSTAAMVGEVLRQRAKEWMVIAGAYLLSGQFLKAAGYAAGAAALEAGAGAAEFYAERATGGRSPGYGEEEFGGIGERRRGEGGGTSYGAQIRGEKIEVNISPVVSITGETIIIGTAGIEELKESIGKATVEAVQDAMDTGEIDVRQAT